MYDHQCILTWPIILEGFLTIPRASAKTLEAPVRMAEYHMLVWGWSDLVIKLGDQEQFTPSLTSVIKHI